MQVGDERLRFRRVVLFAIHIRFHGARQDRIDAHALRPVFRRQRLRQADQASLAGGVGGRAGETDRVAHERRREDDRSTALLRHLCDLVLGAEERAGQVDRQRLVPASFRHLGARAALAQRARVVEGDVELAVLLDRQIHQRAGIVFVPDVTRQRDGLAAGGADAGHKGVQFRLAPRANHDLRALLRKQFRSGQANAAARTRDDRHLAVQSFHDVLRFPLI
ncbi:hypothetical protein D3C86_1567240 [compost metagenome]